MLTHYYDIRAARPEILYDLYGRVLTAIHLSIAEGAELAVDWPQWQDIEGRFGFVMRVLGKPEGLFKVMLKLAGLIEHKLIVCSDLKQIPEDAPCKWMFVRERTSSRSTPSYRRRQEQRAAARGEQPPAKTPERKSTHWLPMQSRSSQQEFGMAIRRIPATEVGAASNAYGLGVAIPCFEV